MKHKLYYIVVLFLLNSHFSHALKGIPIALYPSGEVPNSKPAPAGLYEIYNGNYFHVTRPTLTPYIPNKAIATKAAVLVIAGGSYSGIAIQDEGYATAQKFCDAGITAFVLKYRLPDARIMTDRSIGPLQDAQRALQMIRQRASEWNLDSTKIGVIGFSAGGHLASTLGTHFNTPMIPNPDNISLRPDFMILMYPVITMGPYTHRESKDSLLGKTPSAELVNLFSNEKQVTVNTPPTFIVHSSTDNVVPQRNSILFCTALLEKNVLFEKHFYTTGTHGYGLNSPDPKESMIGLVQTWMSKNGWLPDLTSIKDSKVDGSPLLNAFPNPFIKDFSVSFKLPVSDQNVTLAIYDSKGVMLKSISLSNIEAGKVYTHSFNAIQFNKGLYLLKLTTSHQTFTEKILKTN